MIIAVIARSTTPTQNSSQATSSRQDHAPVNNCLVARLDRNDAVGPLRNPD